MLCAVRLILPAAARAGTYDVVACNAPGANGENRSWTLEQYNSAGKTPPDAANFLVATNGATTCTPTYGINFGVPPPERPSPRTITTLAEDAASNLTRIERTVDLDGTAPVVSRVPVSGRTISALVSDASSGVAGGTIEIRGRRDAPFLALKTTLKDGKLVATVPRTVKANYGIRVSAGDKAGNVMSALVTSMSLSTRVGKHTRKVQNERATVAYGRAVTVLGRLTTTDGSPVANQSIVITGTLRQTGATAQSVAIALTDTGARFSVTLPAGPSRSLSVVYPGAQGILTGTRAVALRVPASSTIHAAAKSVRGAGSVRFTGSLRMLGTTLPPGGKLVDLQASKRGRWSTVATTRATGADGRWHAVARFRGTPGRYPVRLRIRREALFPYELGYSASVAVRVR